MWKQYNKFIISPFLYPQPAPPEDTVLKEFSSRNYPTNWFIEHAPQNQPLVEQGCNVEKRKCINSSNQQKPSRLTKIQF